MDEKAWKKLETLNKDIISREDERAKIYNEIFTRKNARLKLAY